MIFLWSVQKLISWPLCLMSMTAIIVFPAPVFNTAIVFRLFATSNTSSWYLSTWKYTCTYVHMNTLVKFTTFHLIKIYLDEKIKKIKKRNEKTFWGRSAWNCGKLVILEENDQEEHWEDLFQCWRPCHWNFFF